MQPLSEEQRAQLRVHPPFEHNHVRCMYCSWVSLGYAVEGEPWTDGLRWELVVHMADGHRKDWSFARWFSWWARISLRLMEWAESIDDDELGGELT